MRQSWTDDRMDDLNAKVDRVDVDVRALRGEMKSELTSVRAEMKSEFTSVRAEMKGEFTSVRAEMKAGFDRVDQRLDRLIFLLLGLFATALAAFITHL